MPMLKPEISLILPVYQNETTLRRALDSVFSQKTAIPYELVAAIDPCKDKSLDILKEYQAKHPENFVILAPETRLGNAKCRQLAVEKARGEYVAFLDADDKLHPDFFEKMYAAITKNKADLVSCAFYVVKGQKKERHFVYPFRRSAVLNRKGGLNAYFSDAALRGFMWAKLYRRSLFFEAPTIALPHLSDMFEDQSLNTALLAHCHKVVLLRSPLTYYYKNIPTSLSSVKRQDRAMCHLRVFALQRYYFEQTQDQEGLKAWKKHISRADESFRYDCHVDKRNGASKVSLKEVKALWRVITDLKKPLPAEGALADWLKAAYVTDASRDRD